MYQEASRLETPFVFSGDAVSAASRSGGGPGLRRVRLELARPGSVSAKFDSRASRLRRTKPDASRRM